MRKLIVAEKAEFDLVAIGDFIALDSPLNASRFVQKLRKNFALLIKQPFIGRARDEFSTGLRSISFGHYMIFYRVANDEVEIARVIHGSRDIKRAFER